MEKLIAAVKALIAKQAFKLFSRNQLYMETDFNPFLGSSIDVVKEEVTKLYTSELKDGLNKPVVEFEANYPDGTKGLIVQVGLFKEYSGHTRLYVSKEPVTDDVIARSDRMRAIQNDRIQTRIAKIEANANKPQKQPVVNTRVFAL